MEDLATENVSFGSGGDGMTAGEALQPSAPWLALHQFWNKTDTLLRAGWTCVEDQLGDWLAVRIDTCDAVCAVLARSSRRALRTRSAMHAEDATTTSGNAGQQHWFIETATPVTGSSETGRLACWMATDARALASAILRFFDRHWVVTIHTPLLEDELVQAYIDALAGEGVQVRPDAIWHVRTPPRVTFEAMVVTLAIGQMMPLAWNLRMIRRTAALADHTVSPTRSSGQRSAHVTAI